MPIRVPLVDIFAIARNLLSQIRSEGAAAAFRSLSFRAHTQWMEWRLGIDTDARVTAQDLGYADADCRGYLAAEYSSLQIILPMLSLGPNDVFIDLGCGMGRAVVLAAQYPIKRAIGIERSTILAKIANENIRTARKLRCSDLKIVTEDATRYQIPNDTTVIFMFSPFSGTVLDAVLDNIQLSLERAPRQLRLACLVQRDLPFDVQLRSTSWLQLSGEMGVGGSICSFYRAAGNQVPQKAQNKMPPS